MGFAATQKMSICSRCPLPEVSGFDLVYQSHYINDGTSEPSCYCINTLDK